MRWLAEMRANDAQVDMYRRSIRISAPPVGSTLLLSMLLAGCGVTSTQLPVAATSGTTSSQAASLVPLGPQLGYVWNTTEKNLYPVLGIAGAAHFGASLLPADAAYVSGAVSGSAAGKAAWALVLDSTGTLDALTLPSTVPSVVATRIPLDATLIFAPSGGYAVVLSVSANTALLISGLPAQPQVSPLAVPGGSALTGAAVSDRGTVLAAWTNASGAQAGILHSTGATAITNVSAWGGAGFVPGVAAVGQEQAVIADAGAGSLIRLSMLGSSTPTATTLGSAGKLKTPVAVAIAGDGKWVYAADSTSSQIVRLDLSGSAPALSIPCACQPARLVSLPGSMIFAVSADQAEQPAWLLDGHLPAPRTFFVPALTSTVAITSSAPLAKQGASR